MEEDAKTASGIGYAYCETCREEHAFGFDHYGEMVEFLSCRRRPHPEHDHEQRPVGLGSTNNIDAAGHDPGDSGRGGTACGSNDLPETADRPPADDATGRPEAATAPQGAAATPRPKLMPDLAEFTYAQDGDSNDDGPMQSLTVRVENAGAGPYLVVETKRWALEIDAIDDLAATLRWCAAQCRED